MNTKVELVEEYGKAFRDLVNTKIRSSEAVIRDSLRLSKDEDWAFLCVSMDIVGDACTAINHFLKFGLNGPTKYDETGEKYLRLYGILSATYIQQQALLKLHQLMNVPPSVKKARELVNSLLIRSLRHKLCAHSVDYLDKKTGSIEAHIPIRIDLDNFTCTYGKDGRGNQNSVDLKVAVDEHLNTMVELLDKIMEKAVKTLFKGQESSKACTQFSEVLNDLRVLRKGGIVHRLPEGRKLIITMGNEI